MVSTINFEWHSRIPNHHIKLKVCVPVTLLRNINKANGICKQTILHVKLMGRNVISTVVITENKVDSKIFILKMNLIPYYLRFPFKFKKR